MSSPRQPEGLFVHLSVRQSVCVLWCSTGSRCACESPSADKRAPAGPCLVSFALSFCLVTAVAPAGAVCFTESVLICPRRARRWTGAG